MKKKKEKKKEKKKGHLKLIQQILHSSQIISCSLLLQVQLQVQVQVRMPHTDQLCCNKPLLLNQLGKLRENQGMFSGFLLLMTITSITMTHFWTVFCPIVPILPSIFQENIRLQKRNIELYYQIIRI